jgi:hypothetical protein
LGAVLVFLWHVDAMSLGTASIWAAAIVAGLWANGRFLQGGLTMLEVLTVECAALATLSALEMMDGYLVFKPLTMIIAIIFVAVRAHSTGVSGALNS